MTQAHRRRDDEERHEVGRLIYDHLRVRNIHIITVRDVDSQISKAGVKRQGITVGHSS